MYSQGRGVPVDGDEAVRWYRKAAGQNYAPAEYKLAMLYFEGDVIPRNLPEAMRWFHRAADHGSAAAENQIGSAYQYGRGVPQSDAEAEKWYRTAAEHGLQEARRNLESLRSGWLPSARPDLNRLQNPLSEAAVVRTESTGPVAPK
jgi:TPR repeat protein